MARTTPMLSLLGALALAGSVSATCNKDCVNPCARAVRSMTGPDRASRLADCSSFLAATVTPAASTSWVTEYKDVVTVTVTAEAVLPTSQTVLKKRGDTVTASAPESTVPAYLSDQCSDAEQYSHACACMTVSASTLTVAVADVTSTTTVASTTTWYDNPPLASSSVVFPDDNSWTATYTYAEYTLPVFTSAPDPSVVVDYPTPTPVCLMGSNPTGDAFYLLAPNAGYVVKRDGALGPVEQPADEAAAKALLANWNPPTFEFQAAQNAPDGLFDLVIRDGSSPDLYVALDVDTGAISLVSSSTYGVAQDGKCTTVFGVSCKGSLLLEYGSTTYVWTITDSTTVATPGTPATDNTADTLNTMLLLPVRVRTPVDLSVTASTSTKKRRSSGTTPWKRDMSQYGVAQRCPGFDSQMVAVSNGRAGSAPNGCGPDGAWYSALVPNLNFGGCCNTHDECYDSCPQYFEKCNNDFLWCMANSCNVWFDHWYDFFLLPGCYAAADLYFAAVSGGTAAGHFQDGSNKLCNCQCADSNLAICTPQGKTCQRVRGVGASDSQNCGGCGQDCGDKAYCSDAVCRCKPVPPTPNQCGNMCLDFKTHPRNCGACGNVCASGYCYQGACFTPPADTDICYPVYAVTNGDFTSGLTGWAVPSTSTMIEGIVVEGPTSGTNALSMWGVDLSPFSKTLIALTAQTTLRLCPGVQYKLEFQVWALNTVAVLSIGIGDKNLVDGEEVPDESVWLPKGPYTLPIFNKGDAGTSEDGLFLDVGLNITFSSVTKVALVYMIADVVVYSTGS